MNEFIAVFGQRYVGLIDNANTYTTYRVPRPQAPYPQDYLVDQQGVVQYWSDEYDPQKIIKIIDRLLISEIKEKHISANPSNNLNLSISPNPSNNKVVIAANGFLGTEAMIKIFNPLGELVSTLRLSRPGAAAVNLDLPAGVYFVRLEVDRQSLSRTLILAR